MLKKILQHLPTSRDDLHDGIGRKLLCRYIPIIVSICSLIFLLAINFALGKSIGNFFPSGADCFKFACGISAALTIMTYNLRNKAFDYFKAELSSKYHPECDLKTIIEDAEKTAQTITNITLTSFITSILLGSSIPLLDNLSLIANIFVACSIGALVCTFFSYLYVLFTIERAESEALKNILVARELELKKEERANMRNSTTAKDTDISEGW